MAGNELVTMNRFPQIILALKEGAKVAVRQVASQDVLPDAQANCPVDTGATQASGYWVASDMSTYAQAVGAAASCDNEREMLPEVDHPTSQTEAVVAFAAHNAVYIHEGTRRMPPRPFLAQAAAGARSKVTERVGQELTRAIKAVSL